jgi:hypothetical protein
MRMFVRCDAMTQRVGNVGSARRRIRLAGLLLARKIAAPSRIRNGVALLRLARYAVATWLPARLSPTRCSPSGEMNRPLFDPEHLRIAAELRANAWR